jgi:phosphatidylglycerol lysyltransferase
VVEVDAAQLLAEHGRNPFSGFVRYDATWQWHENPAGAAPYLEHGRVVLVWVDPLAADPGAFLRDFTRELRARRRRICLVLIGEEVGCAARALGYVVLKVGEQPYFDFTTWRMPRGDPGKHLRWCLNLAQRAGVEVREHGPGDDAAVLEVLEAWESGLGRAPADSFLRASPLAQHDEKRLFLAWRGGRVDALVACSTVPAANGWLLEDLIRRPDAANGATEAAVVRALETLAADGAACTWLDVAPLRGLDSQIDRRARILFHALGPLVSFFDARYRFRALTTYLGKFQPTSWTPRYVALKPVVPTPGLVRALRELL